MSPKSIAAMPVRPSRPSPHVLFTAALVLAAAATPASANFWSDLRELDNKKAAIDARIDDALGALKNSTTAMVEHAWDKAEAKVEVDKEAMAAGLAAKLQNLTLMKEDMDDHIAQLKVDGDAKFWKLMNKTERVEAAKKDALAQLTNKTIAHFDENEKIKNAVKEESEKQQDANKEAMDARIEELKKEAAEKATLAAEKIANATEKVGEGLEAKAEVVNAKLNATAEAAKEKIEALDEWKDGLKNVTLAKNAALEAKINATLADKDKTHELQEEALEEKAKAFTKDFTDLAAAKDGGDVKAIQADADHAEKTVHDAGSLAVKLANVTDAVEGKLADVAAHVETLKQEHAVDVKAKVNASAAKWDGIKAAKAAALNATLTAKKAEGGPKTDLGAAASSLKLPSVRKSIPGVGNAFFAAQAAEDAATAPTAGSGVAPAGSGSGGPPAATAAFQVELPKAVTADWTPAKQTAYVDAVAAWARVPPEAVTVQAVSSAAGAVDTAVDFADEASAAGFARRLAADGAGLGSATTAAGLGSAKPTDVKVAGADAAPGATGAGAAAAGGGGGKASGLSAGAIAGITVGSAAGAALLAAAVGTGVAVSRKKRGGAGGTPLTNA